MSEQTDEAPIDKSKWGPGPWQREQDRVEWEHAGLPCLAIRSELGGNWCGYAAVPPGHPLHGQHYDQADQVDIGVHGGLTYSGRCSGRICHVPKPGEPDDVWWFGFDCGHCFDFMPAMEARMKSYHTLHRRPPYNHATAIDSTEFGTLVYRTIEYVQAETNTLAEQLAACGASGT